MKKLIGMFLAFLLVPSLAFAANMSCTASITGGNLGTIMYTILSDDAAGTATCTAYGVQGYVVRVTTKPGGTAPTDAWDFTLTDALGADILGGKGTDAGKAASIYTFLPYVGIDGFPAAVVDSLTINCTNMGNAKTATVQVIFERP